MQFKLISMIDGNYTRNLQPHLHAFRQSSITTTYLLRRTDCASICTIRTPDPAEHTLQLHLDAPGSKAHYTEKLSLQTSGAFNFLP